MAAAAMLALASPAAAHHPGADLDEVNGRINNATPPELEPEQGFWDWLSGLFAEEG